MTDQRNDIAATAPTQPAPASAAGHDTMRRLQIGIAGVVIVLLLVGMAGLIGESARENAADNAAAAIEVKMPGAPVVEEAKTSAPLEELGVQPVSKDENEDISVKVPQTVAPAVVVPDLEPDPKLARARQKQ